MIPGVLTQGVMNPQVRGLADIAPLAPELLVVLGAFALLMLDLFLDERRRIVTHVGAIIVLLAAACLVAAGVGGQGSVMHDMLIRDDIADVLKIRSEARRVGTEYVSKCNSRWSPYPKKKKQKK